MKFIRKIMNPASQDTPNELLWYVGITVALVLVSFVIPGMVAGWFGK